MAATSIDRREFLQGLATSGLVLAFTATGCRRISDRYGAPGDASAKGTAGATPGGTAEPFAPAVYVRIGDDGEVTAIVHRSEMGQGTKTSLAMALADELEADWARVRVEQAPGDDKRYGNQDTDGSWSIRGFLQPLREAGATARAMLEQAAAQRWQVPVADVRAQHHRVVHPGSGRAFDYRDLVAIARTLPVPAKEQLRLKQPSEFRYLGKGVPMVDLHDMTVGRARYGIDQHLPGMKVAVVARPPVYGGTLRRVDDRAARAVPGVERIVRIPATPPPSGMSPLGGVAVVATNTWAAIQGRKALKLTWRDGPHGVYNSATYRTSLERSVRSAGKVARTEGNAAVALQHAATRLSAEYYIPHLAHASMEPPAALASVTPAGCEVWAPSQSPQGARDAVAKALGIPTDRVTMHVTLLGGGFGRKSMHDFIIEAALLSRAVGAPVKVLWTREDDLQHDYFHTVAVEHLEGGLDDTGHVVAWLHRSALPAINSTFSPNVLYQDESELGMGVTDLPYAIPNLRGEAGPATSHTRIGWLRSVINIPHAFAISSFIDELAHAAHRDPKDFIIELLGPDHVVDMARAGVTGKLSNYDASFEDYPIDTARFRAVVELAAKQSGWGQPLPAGQGRGIAVHRSFLTYVASVVQVEVRPDGTVAIPRVDVAVDAGFVAHPERAESQIEGATIMGLGNAIHGQITFTGGRADQSNFDTYAVLRMDEAPAEIHVHLVPSTANPAGIGEPGVPPTAPALCNAIYAATGQRIRSLPVATQLKPGAVADDKPGDPRRSAGGSRPLPDSGIDDRGRTSLS
jgi:isoquinoline 1-oxidoreductase subunit beta